MSKLVQVEDFEILEKHKEWGVKFISGILEHKKKLIDDQHVIFSDFYQGKIGNCGLIAALSSL